MLQPDQVTPAFLLLSFSPVATGFFSPPKRAMGRGCSGGSSKGGTQGCLWGSWPGRQAGQSRSSRTLGASVSHTHPLSLTRSHIPLSRCPSSFSRFAGPPSVSWFLPGSGSYTEGHSFTLRCMAHPHCCPVHTHTHTHPYCMGT